MQYYTILLADTKGQLWECCSHPFFVGKMEGLRCDAAIVEAFSESVNILYDDYASSHMKFYDIDIQMALESIL